MKFITFSTILFFFGLSSIAFSSAVPPTKCPSIEAIKTSPSHLWINKIGAQNYLAFQDKQKFNTDDMWGIIIGDIDASSMGEAEQKAKNALSAITCQYGPKQQSSDVWRCIYDTAPGYQVITYTILN